MRRLTILALGSRGDVQPFIALGLGLRAAGYQVRVAAALDYADLIQGYGLAYAPLVGRIRDLMDWQAIYALQDATWNPLGLAHHFQQQVEPVIPRLVADAATAADDADGLIVSTLGVYIGAQIAERRGMPMLPVHFHPWGETATAPAAFAPPLPARLPGRGLYNRLTHRLIEPVMWTVLGRSLNRARRALGLAPSGLRWLLRQTRQSSPLGLLGYSPLLAPPPPDLAPRYQITGHWHVDAAPVWTPPPELVTFLAAGPPPVYIGFGSLLVGRDPDRITALLVEALARTAQRGVLLTGWGDIGNIDLPPTVIKIDSVTHSWLFPQVAAVVHHGGAGTTVAALRAGKPAVIVPYYGDMVFWAQRVHALGAGPPPMQRADVSAHRLAELLQEAMGNPGYKAQAEAVGARLRAETGVATAINLIQQYL